MKNGLTVDKDGTKIWYLNDEYHRVDRHAVEGKNGYRAWYLNGKMHRVGKPAIEDADGNKHWVLNDKRHRVEGPAIEDADGNKVWYLNGIELNEIQIKTLKKINSCSLRDLPLFMGDELFSEVIENRFKKEVQSENNMD